MESRLINRLRRFKAKFFPVRQIYLRSEGRVRFVTFKPWLQITVCLLFIGTVAWTLVASLNLIFKDEILAAKEREILSLGSHYEVLNSEYRALQRNVYDKARTLEAQQAELTELTRRHLSLGENGEENAPLIEDNAAKPDENADTSTNLSDNSWNESALLPSRSPSKTMLGRLTSFAATVPFIGENVAVTENPGARMERDSAEILIRVEQSQSRIITALISETERELSALEETISVTGLSSDQVVAAVDPTFSGMGGPLLPVRADGSGDASDKNEDGAAGLATIDTLSDLILRMETLQRALSVMPLVKPVKDEHYISSGFGRRRDPFTGRRAIHAGIDIAGHWKTPIFVPAAGKVVYAGPRGAYGKMVEIDHGHGFRTRYGHLNTIKVAKNDLVQADTVIGLMGNSGRSTSTHVHYEIWFNGKYRNPMKFLRAANHVQKK